jgi:hypothetical protein
MSRISSSSFKVNSDLEQLVSVTNTTAIPVSDSTAQGSLSTIAGAVSGSEMQVDIVSSSGTLTVSDSTAQGSLSTIAGAVTGSEMQVDIVSSLATLDVSDSTAQGSLSTLAAAVSSNQVQCNVTNLSLQTSDSIAQGSLSTIAGAVSSSEMQCNITNTSVPVSFSANNNSGSAGNLDNASSVVSGDFSSEVDVRTAKNITIIGSTTDSSYNNIEVHVSASSGSGFVKWSYDIYPDSSGNFSQQFQNIAVNYIKLKYNASATVTATALYNN